MKKPKFELGQSVKYPISVNIKEGVTIRDVLDLYVVGISITSSAYSQTFEYTLAKSMPDAHYPGSGFFRHVQEGSIS